MDPNKARLLIVEDSESMREIVRELLQDLGIVNIDEAPDGRTALTMFRRQHYDLVLTAWNMPFISGIDLVRSIRHGSVRKQTPVVVLSTDVSEPRAVEALSAGANGFVQKPFPPQTLCEKVLPLLASLGENQQELRAAS